MAAAHGLPAMGTLHHVHYTDSQRGQKWNLKNSPPYFGPLGPLDPIAKGFRFLKLHLLFPPEHGLRPAARVHHPTPFSHSHLCLGSETI